jgi:integration host factor subunit alpha
MTKADIVALVSEKMGCKKMEAVDHVESVLSLMKNTLESGEILKISGFGSFIVKQKADRRGRNPQTGETITIEARRILTFKPSNLLRDAINKQPKGACSPWQ